MKKAIDWFVLAVGLALAASGARWMWTGWDVVQVERGWASLISGAVMLSGGLVVFALAWVAMRVSGLSSLAPRVAPSGNLIEPSPVQALASIDASKVSLGAAAVTAAAAAVATAAVVGEKSAQEPELPHDSEPHDAPAARPPSLPSASELLKLSENRRAELDDARADEISETGAVAETSGELREPKHEVSTEPPPVPPNAPVEPELPAVAAIPDPPPEPKPEPEPQPAPPPVAPEPPPVASQPPQIPEPPAAPPPSLKPEADADAPVDDAWLEETKRSLDRELGRSALPENSADDSDTAQFQPPAPAAEPAVVGRYSSGDTNYVMFGDGSIEAQTPEGAMRFASLVELRRFVEQRN